MYRHLTRVQRSLIRVDADELTYPLHIMLRYELEKQLLAGELAVRDLPEAWNAGMEQRLGIRPANDVEGCLQDIHWAVGSFGYFPSYALGAVIAAQLYESLRAALPSLDEELARGEFGGLFDWLRDNVHGVGAKLPVQDLIKRPPASRCRPASFVRYLEAKYLETREQRRGLKAFRSARASAACGLRKSSSPKLAAKPSRTLKPCRRSCAARSARRSPTTA